MPHLRSDIYEAALAQFETYAAMDAPRVPDDSFSAVQVSLCRWANEQFGAQRDLLMVAGIVEEVGEFAEAPEGVLEADAIADVLIYATQLCTSNRLDFGVLWAMRDRVEEEEVSDLDTFVSLGRLSHIALKSEQKIRGFDDRDKARQWYAAELVRFFGLVDFVATARSIDAIATYKQVAAEVVKRSWKRDPLRAGVGA